MAKWGEGDPRWIVEDRPDATNVNNWHWTEKNACQWSKEKLKELLVNFKFDTSVGKCTITELEKCEGDASANNRKAKIIIFFEWELRLKWKAKLNNESGETVLGTVEIPNLSDENGVNDLDIQFLTDSKLVEAELIKQSLRLEGTSKIQAQLEKYVQALKDEFTQGMILPKKESSSTSTTSCLSNLNLNDTSTSSAKNVVKPSSEPVKLSLTNLVTNSTMKCTAQDVYNALTRPEMFVAFTNGSGKIDPVVGGAFEMFGGNVHGKILELDEPKKIVQDWRFRTWPEGVYSRVTFTIEQNADSTEITVRQKGLPKSDLEKTKEGWDKYYFSAMKRTFGFGSMML